MQIKLNAAGYTDYEGIRLEEDGILGPRTKSAAYKAGINPDTWNGEPEIEPASNDEETDGEGQLYGDSEELLQAATSRAREEGDANGYIRAQQEYTQQKLMNDFTQTEQALNKALDDYNKNNPASNKRINYIRAQIQNKNFADAKAKASKLAQIVKRNKILPMIDTLERAYQTMEMNKQTAVNEVRTKFYDIFNRINNATILQ